VVTMGLIALPAMMKRRYDAAFGCGTICAAGTLGHRARKRLEAHADFLDVLLLAEADRRGRQRGLAAPSLDEAIAILRCLATEDDAPPEADGAVEPPAG